MRIAVLGNSHVACVRSAWDAVRDRYPGVHLTFFAAGRRGLADLLASNGRLVPGNSRLREILTRRSGGVAEIDPTKYDAFILVGLGLSMRRIRRSNYSRAVCRQSIIDAGKSSLSYSIAEQLQALSTAPVVVYANPLLAADESSQFVSPSVYETNLTTLRHDVFAPIGSVLVEQPSSTVVKGFWTRPEYCIGSAGLEAGDGRPGRAHGGQDRAHMNEKYGVLLIQSALEGTLGCRPKRGLADALPPWLRRVGSLRRQGHRKTGFSNSQPVRPTSRPPQQLGIDLDEHPAPRDLSA